MDTITLKRQIEGEYTPRYYTVSGKEFNEMLAAVKALPFRKWESIDKLWLVRGEGIKALQEAGYTVEQEKDVRAIPGEIDTLKDIDQHRHIIRIHAIFEVRSPRRGWSGGVLNGDYYKNAVVEYSDEQIAAMQTQIDERNKVLWPDIKCPPADLRSVAHVFAARFTLKAQREVQDLFEKALNGERTEEAFMRGYEALAEYLSEDSKINAESLMEVAHETH